jgi:heat shock protein HslJ
MKNVFYIVLVLALALCSCSVFSKKGSAASKEKPNAKLEGAWELVHMPISDNRSFDSVFKNKRPFMSFELTNKRFGGNTSCNSFGGALIATADSISFKGDIVMTMMACLNSGEDMFLSQLKKISRYNVSADGHTLSFMQGDMLLMTYKKKTVNK